MRTIDRIQSLLEPLPRKFKVRFALSCCNDIKDLISDPDSLEAIRITRLWLEDKATVEEVDMAGNKAYSAASASHASAAYAAASASYAAYATSAASAASAYYAASTAARAASASAYASSASASAYAASSYDDKMLQYEADLKNIITDLTKLEKIVYDIK